MMTNISSFGGMMAWSFHGIFSLLILLALVFFVAWAVKNLKADKLLNWTIGLLIIGVIGWLLTASMTGWHRSFGWGSGGYGMMGGYGSGMMMGGMMDCVQDEKCLEGMETFMDRMMGHEETK